MISIVMTSYNGEKYICEQLDSIRKQKLIADEVIIRDDGSTDGTINLVNSYIEKYGLETWQFIYGQQNVGWKRNFYEAITMAQGDYIFLCDQDDIWHEDKVESIVNVMENYPEIELLVSGYHSFYEAGANYLRNRGDLKDDGSICQIPFDKNCLNITYPGCTFCFRKNLKRRFKEYWFESSPHDAMLWYLAMQNDGLYVYNKVLMEYRRHKESATNHMGHYTVEKQLEIYKRHIKVIDILLNINRETHPDRTRLLNNIKKWYLHRINMVESRRLIYIFALIPELKYYYGLRSFLVDIKLTVIGDKNFLSAF